MSAIKDELQELETKYWQALKDKDGVACAELCADPSTVVGAQGIRIIPQERMRTLIEEDTSFRLVHFKLHEMETRMLGPEVGVVTYRVDEKLVLEGKEVSFTAYDASVWVHRQGKWLCALHTEAVQGDPFGRDRKAHGQQG
ncbi:MAG: nuclear transport factor 2 family protein [Flavobacteriales bacterium]